MNWYKFSFLGSLDVKKMFKHFRKEKETNDAYENVIEGLKNIYKSKLLPLEQTYKFHEFHSPPLDDSDFESKPMVLLVGQYSTGIIFASFYIVKPRRHKSYNK